MIWHWTVDWWSARIVWTLLRSFHICVHCESTDETCASVFKTLHITPKQVLKLSVVLTQTVVWELMLCIRDCCEALHLNSNFFLAIIFNNYSNTGIESVEWRNSMVVPIFKKSFRSDPLNYCPISLTSVVCKSLERIIVSRLIDYFYCNHLRSSEHFWFRKA